MKNKSALVLLAIVAFLLSTSRSNAATIGFTVADLGGGEWRYDYYVSDVTFQEFDGFSIFFDAEFYADLTSPSTSNANWLVDVLPPDVIFGTPVDGLFDAIALSSGVSIAAPFSVRFRFSGPGTPDWQPFELTRFAFDPVTGDPSVQILAVGQTSPIPEPGTLLLVGSGVALVVRRARRKIATRT